jgi:SAM-dependent methyltransferase
MNYVEAFNRDVSSNQGYLYTTHASLSSYLANRRLTDAALTLADFRGKRVLDIGCGDGAYTFELFDRGKPASMTGIDPAQEAIKSAKQKKGDRKITFETQNAESLPYPSDSFDLVHIRGVLHHMNKPIKALAEAFRVAPSVIVIEPNGYNPILKLLERLSKYHIKHGEKSYTPRTLREWISQLGGKVEEKQYAGLVPFFCPDLLARLLKSIERPVENVPILKSLACAVYVIVAVRKNS